MAKTRTNRGTYTIEDIDYKRVGGTYESYVKADKAISAIKVVGTFHVVCRWPAVTLAPSAPKLVRTVAEPDTEPGAELGAEPEPDE